MCSIDDVRVDIVDLCTEIFIDEVIDTQCDIIYCAILIEVDSGEPSENLKGFGGGVARQSGLAVVAMVGPQNAPCRLGVDSIHAVVIVLRKCDGFAIIIGHNLAVWQIDKSFEEVGFCVEPADNRKSVDLESGIIVDIHCRCLQEGVRAERLWGDGRERDLGRRVCQDASHAGMEDVAGIVNWAEKSEGVERIALVGFLAVVYVSIGKDTKTPIEMWRIGQICDAQLTAINEGSVGGRVLNELVVNPASHVSEREEEIADLQFAIGLLEGALYVDIAEINGLGSETEFDFRLPESIDIRDNSQAGVVDSYSITIGHTIVGSEKRTEIEVGTTIKLELERDVVDGCVNLSDREKWRKDSHGEGNGPKRDTQRSKFLVLWPNDVVFVVVFGAELYSVEFAVLEPKAYTYFGQLVFSKTARLFLLVFVETILVEVGLDVALLHRAVVGLLGSGENLVVRVANVDAVAEGQRAIVLGHDVDEAEINSLIKRERESELLVDQLSGEVIWGVTKLLVELLVGLAEDCLDLGDRHAETDLAVADSWYKFITHGLIH